MTQENEQNVELNSEIESSAEQKIKINKELITTLLKDDSVLLFLFMVVILILEFIFIIYPIKGYENFLLNIAIGLVPTIILIVFKVALYYIKHKVAYIIVNVFCILYTVIAMIYYGFLQLGVFFILPHS